MGWALISAKRVELTGALGHRGAAHERLGSGQGRPDPLAERFAETFLLELDDAGVTQKTGRTGMKPEPIHPGERIRRDAPGAERLFDLRQRERREARLALDIDTEAEGRSGRARGAPAAVISSALPGRSQSRKLSA